MKRLGTSILICFFGSILILFFRYYPFNPNQNKDICNRQIVCSNCNVILLSVDSLRYDHTTISGYYRNTTPFLASLLSTSIEFPLHFTSSFLTAITQMSIQTGMYPSTSGYIQYTSPIADSIPSMPMLLKTHGYQTSSVHSSPEYFLPRFGAKDVFARGYDSLIEMEPRTLSNKNEQILFSEIERLKKNKQKFFLWTSIGSVHWPYGFNAKHVFDDPKYSGVLKDTTLDWTNTGVIRDYILYPSVRNQRPNETVISRKIIKKTIDGEETSEFDNRPEKQEPVTIDDIQYVVDHYDNGVRAFDEFLQKIFAKLEKEKLRDKTIVIITSEHGEGLYENGYIAHYDIRDIETQTPLVIVLPSTNIGQRIYSLTSSVDILPTMLTLLDLPIPPHVQGINLIPSSCNPEQQKKHTEVISERTPLWEHLMFDHPDIVPNIPILHNFSIQTIDRYIRTNEWKYIERNSGSILSKASWWTAVTGKPYSEPQEELYYINTDPKEQINVIHKFPEVRELMKSKLSEWKKQNIRSEAATGSGEFVQDYF